ncbi:MAG TPA: TOMM precursor leader peptide-binding protein, partial [Pseudonocardiaceae bacterium]|nr:TOMM precursor leader peptide-binding protein [Pseudonocardiaceae bacterium]
RVGFRRHLRVEVARDDKVYLFGERGLTVLAGSGVSAVAPLLDGSRDLPALQADAPAGLADDQLTGVLARLADLGVLALRPTRPVADDAALAYWDGAGMDAVDAASSVTNGTVRVVTVGDIDVDRSSAVLRMAGLNVVTGAADLSIVLCADYLDPRLAAVDAAHRLTGRPWLLAKPVGTIIWVGPVFQPTAAGCWSCLEQPLSRHRNAESCAQEALGHDELVRCPDSSVPPLASAALNLIALEAVKWLAGYRHEHQQSVWTFDSLDLSGRHHALRNRPQCPVCGDPDLVRAQARRPVVLRPDCRIADSAGGHRALSAERVRDRYQHLVSPVTGIIKEIRRDDHGPAFFNSFRSGANIAAKARSLTGLRSVLRNSNGGKGTTALQAEVGALCEAAERYSGSFHGDEERIRGSLRSLGELAIHPNACQLFDERQYRTRMAWNAEHSPFQFVGEPFTDNTIADWTPVWSFTQRRHRLLPTGLLYFGAPTVPGQVALVADSNGNAAGSSLEDAVLQGLFEVVERDAVAIWWYNRSRVSAVDLSAFADPWIAELRTVYAGLRRDVWVLDVTSDLGVPTMVAVSRRTDSETEDVMFGFGAHLDPAIALRRALTELNQLMPAVVDPGTGRDLACDDPDATRWWRQATVANQPYLLPDPTREPLRPSDYHPVVCGDIGAEVGLIRQRLEARGMELLVLDQTRPDIELPVVKVIVPGMRHFWSRLAPGRLYDVPVRLGRQSAPTSYEDLNPHPMFL